MPSKMACLTSKVRGVFLSTGWNKAKSYCFMRTIISGNAMRTTSYSTKTSADDEEDPGPAKFSTSKAAVWRAKQTRSGGRDNDAPPYQPYVVSLSLAVFMLYFCVFREENDLDEEISKPLYDRIEGLKAKQLEIAFKYNRDHGLPTADLERELQALGISID